MYSLIPAIVALFFLFYGLYVLHSKGLNEISAAFLILCTTTFFWQSSWAVLFQVDNPDIALYIIKFGWLLILFLPTSLYHFLIKLARQDSEQVYVNVAYCFSGGLAVLLLTGNLVVDGYYEYFWGFYPKAGPLLVVHIGQTALVVLRGLYVTYQKFKIVQASEKTKLKYCIGSIFIYFLAAMDYLCNYGVEMYPPGVLFITVSLGIVAVAITKYRILDQSKTLAASIAHEMRGPLATLGVQSELVSKYVPTLIETYRAALDQNLVRDPIPKKILDEFLGMSDSMRNQIAQAQFSIDSLVALTTDYQLNEKDFTNIDIADCVESALERMPNQEQIRKHVQVDIGQNFSVSASPLFLSFVIINIIKNALDAIDGRENGKVVIQTSATTFLGELTISDNGCGISKDRIPHIYDSFYSTKARSTNTGVGLHFCKNIMDAFGADIHCVSKVDRYTRFTLVFKQIAPAQLVEPRLKIVGG